MKRDASEERILPRQLHGLSAPARAALQRALKALELGNPGLAERELTICLVHAPHHAEPHRLLGITLRRLGRPAHAVASFRAALAAAPDDSRILRGLAQAQADGGDLAGAIATARRLVVAQADAEQLKFLADLLERHAEMEEALRIAERALAADPHCTRTQLQRGRCLFQTGSIDAAAAQFRQLLAQGREVPAAWHGLGELRSVKFSAADRDELQRLTRAHYSGIDLAVLKHVLAQAHEGLGDFAAAYTEFVEAARLEHAKFPWDRAVFERYITELAAAFAEPVATASARGHEVIFIVGMPRAGSTLVEQILAAHPAIEGASELPDLKDVIQRETAQRRAQLSQWAPRATPLDWQRLGENYLAQTQRWRERKPRFTDKMPGNWMYAEAALAMLPGARIIDCRRDALETCWSCFKQFFAPGAMPWTRTFEDLAHYLRLCQAHGDRLAARYPQRFRIQSYEALLDEPEAQTRQLLDFCGVDFDAACLRPHEAQRTVRTASAAQVRQPLQRKPSNVQRYGALLDPLRQALDMYGAKAGSG